MIAVYPGTFDPITNGHLDIINRSSKIASKVIVAVLDNISKSSFFTSVERVEMISASIDLPNVEVRSFSGLLVDFAKEVGANVVIRGLRTTFDFEYEFRYALNNKRLDPKVETLFLTTSAHVSYLNSGTVKEIASFGGDISSMVPEIVEAYIKEKFLDKRR